MNFIDLAAQQSRISKKINENIAKVLTHGKYINGPEVTELEERLAEFVGVRYAVGCSSGTDALLMNLIAYDVAPGDAIFTTVFTFIATAEVIQLLRATPVFIDIEPSTFNIDINKLENAIEETIKQGKLVPRGIISVDLFGQTADYDEINALAKKYNLFLLEDAAQSFGAMYKGRRSCSLAEVAAASFYPSKPLGCYGDGGMIFTDSEYLYDELISIRDHGQRGGIQNTTRIGINGRLDAIQAAILLAKFELFEEELVLRQEVADRYRDAIRDLVEVPYIKEYNTSAWALYSVMHLERDRLIERFNKEKIPVAIYYPRPLHLQEAFAHLGYKAGDFPISEEVSKKIFSLPMHPYLKIGDQDKIIQILNEFR